MGQRYYLYQSRRKMALPVHCNGFVLQKSHFLAHLWQCGCRTGHYSLPESLGWNRKSFFRRVPCKQCWKINSVSFLSVDRPLYSFPSAFSQSCRLLCRSYHISEEPLKALLFRDACIISDNSVRSDKIKEKISDKSRSAVLLIQHHKDIVFQPVR